MTTGGDELTSGRVDQVASGSEGNQSKDETSYGKLVRGRRASLPETDDRQVGLIGNTKKIQVVGVK